MKKILIFIIIVAIVVFGWFYFSKGSSQMFNLESKQSESAEKSSDKLIYSLADLSPTEKDKIAEAILKGEEIIREKNVPAIRELLRKTQPEVQIDFFEDRVILGLAGFTATDEPMTKEQILNSKEWGVKEPNLVYVWIEQGDGNRNYIEAIKIDGKWYHN